MSHSRETVSGLHCIKGSVQAGNSSHEAVSDLSRADGGHQNGYPANGQRVQTCVVEATASRDGEGD